MKNQSLVTDLLGVLSPGRRKLRQRQEAKKIEEIKILERFLGEYRSLAKLDTCHCSVNALGQFDHEKFGRFINAEERLKQWKLIQKDISAFDLPEMTGGVNPGDQRLIFHLIEFLRPTRVLEIGTHIGASTVHLSCALRRYSKREERSLITVDILNVNCVDTKPWKKFGSILSPGEMINHLECTEFVKFVNQPSLQFLEQDRQKYDLIFLDGSHAAEVVYREIPLALNRLAHGGCVLLHDYFPHLKPLWADNTDSQTLSSQVVPGVYIAVERLLREGSKFDIQPFGGLPWKTKLDSNITSLALLSK